jgi:hypothetical protein
MVGSTMVQLGMRGVQVGCSIVLTGDFHWSDIKHLLPASPAALAYAPTGGVACAIHIRNEVAHEMARTRQL